MNVVLWILQSMLAAVFLGVGVAKLWKDKVSLTDDPNSKWAEDFSPPTLKFIGGIELLGGLGLLLPGIFDLEPILTPLAAYGLALVMIGAAVVHGRRKEKQNIVVNLGLMVILVGVGSGRLMGW